MNIVGMALIIALCIPIVALLVYSPFGRAVGKRLERNSVPAKDASGELVESERRLELLEGDVEILQHSVRELKDDNEFLQQLLEEGRASRALPPDGK
jgi:hypothetical protein